jgi:anaerobic C4-dicarboxylate transporter DcuA
LEGASLMRARGSVIVFMLAAVLVVVLGLFPSLRPSYTVLAGGQESIETLDMAPAIMMLMLAAAGINMLAFKASATATVKGSIMNAGVVARISIAGLGWLGSSFFEGNRRFIIGGISGVVQQHPWVFAIGLFALSILLSIQAATVVTLMPVGVALGLGAPSLIAMFPAVNGYFFLPAYACLQRFRSIKLELPRSANMCSTTASCFLAWWLPCRRCSSGSCWRRWFCS